MQHDPIVRFNIILSIDILYYTIAKITKIFLDKKIPFRSLGFLENFEAAIKARN
jgi:hypothetical protein